MKTDKTKTRAIRKPQAPIAVRATDVDRAAGQRIRHRRETLGLTQDEFALLIGVSYQQAHKYEKGLNRISLGRLAKICKALDMEPNEVVLGNGDRPHMDPDERSDTLIMRLSRAARVADRRLVIAFCRALEVSAGISTD